MEEPASIDAAYLQSAVLDVLRLPRVRAVRDANRIRPGSRNDRSAGVAPRGNFLRHHSRLGSHHLRNLSTTRAASASKFSRGRPHCERAVIAHRRKRASSSARPPRVLSAQPDHAKVILVGARPSTRSWLRSAIAASQNKIRVSRARSDLKRMLDDGRCRGCAVISRARASSPKRSSRRADEGRGHAPRELSAHFTSNRLDHRVCSGTTAVFAGPRCSCHTPRSRTFGRCGRPQ